MIDRSTTLSFLYPLSEYATHLDAPAPPANVDAPGRLDDRLLLVAGLDADLAALQRAEIGLRIEVQRLRRLIRPASSGAQSLSDDEALRAGEQAARVREHITSLYDDLRRLRLDLQCRRVWGES